MNLHVLTFLYLNIKLNICYAKRLTKEKNVQGKMLIKNVKFNILSINT
jgi:hypothetical protein